MAGIFAVGPEGDAAVAARWMIPPEGDGWAGTAPIVTEDGGVSILGGAPREQAASMAPSRDVVRCNKGRGEERMGEGMALGE
ncbi:MAG: hypothetical protein RMJ98_11585 [Myxococcales bacterium]|nr:hypothetical protein [Polyangiaceae bacterium]MDW8249929.1 hypothetical protein [Myxococcales bacterium]